MILLEQDVAFLLACAWGAEVDKGRVVAVEGVVDLPVVGEAKLAGGGRLEGGDLGTNVAQARSVPVKRRAGVGEQVSAFIDEVGDDALSQGRAGGEAGRGGYPAETGEDVAIDFERFLPPGWR